MATAQQPRLRADALRNRERIVSAAREAFVEHGVEGSLDEIARRAGVGNATLYRHFADRSELIHHVTLSVLTRVADQAEAARAEEPDAFRALRRFAHAAVDERVGALCSMLQESIDPTHPDHVVARERVDRGVEELMAAARVSGQLREGVDVGDLMVAIAQLTRPLPGSCASSMFDRFAHRHLQLFLDGLMAPARSELPGSAVTLEDLRRTECPG
ncbi:TetR/AcrR family transcriptional regulator [Streptomyces albireticuli]|uniref:TetR family transcriptional regulator n=1 Tax=Streptomyces albireticuli TaxID=1940 RepID=A0A2A2CZR2_9ACTN|nr:TetR/AcrR family transcriptional regulator [Streptomyces albireticuli]MCD9144410.1 TetR/AcrR family transcriptional regulator [Streptomyces albireticuli]MCD9163527.1 TetR/AcrR family transcriptional regulator [Streptomyces albireticuli]MCD9193087.1 TetR/AcrR family transcriptional regulator [Streptomyces albireticuli]PAU44656.1 TetR family transcriptional regulator [Streptomyces albireticuli]